MMIMINDINVKNTFNFFNIEPPQHIILNKVIKYEKIVLLFKVIYNVNRRIGV